MSVTLIARWTCDCCRATRTTEGTHVLPPGWSYEMEYYGPLGHVCTKERCRVWLRELSEKYEKGEV